VLQGNIEYKANRSEMLARFITMGPVGGNQKVKVKRFLIARGEESSKTRTNRGQENRMLIWVLAKWVRGP
jgi:hypothetical protein